MDEAGDHEVLCSNARQWDCATAIQTPSISITYHAEILQDGTGAVIQCGSTIAKGTKVLLHFIPSVYTDVYWFAPGYSFDSPYGDWVSGAAMPSVDMCNKDQYYIDQTRSYNENGNYSVQTFVSLSVNPLINHPSNKNISINGTLFTCDPPLSDMSQYCVATKPGTATVNFNFGGTYGAFYGDYKIIYDSHGELNASRGFWSEVQRVYENCIWTSLPSSLRIAWNGVLKPRHFLGVRLAVRMMSCISSSDTLSMSI